MSEFYRQIRPFLLLDHVAMITIAAGNENQPDERTITFLEHCDQRKRPGFSGLRQAKFSIYEDCWQTRHQANKRFRELYEEAEELSIFVPLAMARPVHYIPKTIQIVGVLDEAGQEPRTDQDQANGAD